MDANLSSSPVSMVKRSPFAGDALSGSLDLPWKVPDMESSRWGLMELTRGGGSETWRFPVVAAVFFSPVNWKAILVSF
jgi:hypothetical protein